MMERINVAGMKMEILIMQHAAVLNDSLQLMSRGGVVRARLQLDIEHYALGFHKSLNCNPCV
jgi:hypothetical protein